VRSPLGEDRREWQHEDRPVRLELPANDMGEENQRKGGPEQCQVAAREAVAGVEPPVDWRAHACGCGAHVATLRCRGDGETTSGTPERLS